MARYWAAAPGLSHERFDLGGQLLEGIAISATLCGKTAVSTGPVGWCGNSVCGLDTYICHRSNCNLKWSPGAY